MLRSSAFQSLTQQRIELSPYIIVAGMLIMALAAWAYTIAVALWRVRAIILERERHTDWVAAELDAEEGRA